MPTRPLPAAFTPPGSSPNRPTALALAGLLALGLGPTGCAPHQESPGGPAATDASLATDGAAAPADPAATPPSGNAATPRAYIAEEHTYRFNPPAARLKALWQKHLDTCHRLGPAGCQVEQANLSTDDDGTARAASLTLRVANAQVGPVLAGLDADAPRGHEIERTDKTTEVIDTDARLANAQQLRARLQALRDQATKVADIVELETRIAEVQGRIEAAQGQRAYLRQQTERTKLALFYDADGRALDGQTWQPVREAFRDIGATLAATVGFLVRAITVLVPVALVLWPLVWLWRRRRRRARAAPGPVAVPTVAAAPTAVPAPFPPPRP